jgi:NADH:ubiquinone oxidoreductase subunit 5 (subunit L)/multisubunit Na+/H+ antiporter MnhA subunit
LASPMLVLSTFKFNFGQVFQSPKYRPCWDFLLFISEISFLASLKTIATNYIKVKFFERSQDWDSTREARSTDPIVSGANWKKISFAFSEVSGVVSFVGKSAQIGSQTWSPDAIEGPTLVSALVHAATMVTVSVFMNVF